MNNNLFFELSSKNLFYRLHILNKLLNSFESPRRTKIMSVEKHGLCGKNMVFVEKTWKNNIFLSQWVI